MLHCQNPELLASDFESEQAIRLWMLCKIRARARDRRLTSLWDETGQEAEI